MIEFDNAIKLISELNFQPKTENISISSSLGRILAKDISSNIDFPPFDKSTMDGYAINSTDESQEYKIIEIIAAGSMPKRSIQKGECSKIMTGAPLPQGANKVVKFENTTVIDNNIIIINKDSNINIHYKGQDIKKGDKVLSAKTLLRPNEISTLASLGISEIEVSKEPSVGVIITGSEVISPTEELTSGKIYNSNGPQLTTQIQNITNKIHNFPIIKDHKEHIKSAILESIDKFDLTITSGSSSVGDFDFTPSILKELNFEFFFEKVNIKPGKPTLFAQNGNKFFIGIPGNPVSAFFTCEMFVKPLIYKMMGYNYKHKDYYGTIAKTIKRKKSSRIEYVPVYFDGKEIFPLDYSGSGHVSVLSQMNSFIRFNQNELEKEKGQIVSVRQV